MKEAVPQSGRTDSSIFVTVEDCHKCKDEFADSFEEEEYVGFVHDVGGTGRKICLVEKHEFSGFISASKLVEYVGEYADAGYSLEDAIRNAFESAVQEAETV